MTDAARLLFLANSCNAFSVASLLSPRGPGARNVVAFVPRGRADTAALRSTWRVRGPRRAAERRPALIA